MIKGGLLLSGGNASVALLGLLRNIVIARLISVEDFGIASTFAVTMALIEMTSNIAIDRLIVQAKGGNKPRFQATAQAIQAARGATGALVLLLVAEPLAALFDVPHIAWAYQAMAAIPLIRGFAHLDMFRLQRNMRFLPSVMADLSAQLGATAAAIPLAIDLGDYRAMLWALLLQQGIYVSVSHLVARRPYRWAFDRQVVSHAISFGWPLLLNGLLMFAAFHGDRIVIGTLVGMAQLGLFSAAFTLTLTPTLVMARTLQSFFLPQLSRAQDNQLSFRHLSLVTMQAALLAGVALAVAFALAGPFVLSGLYGDRYVAAVPVLLLLGIMQGLRLVKAGLAIIALAKGDTANPLFANLCRILMLPIAWLAVKSGGGVETVAGLAILGEGAAIAVSFLLLRRTFDVTIDGLRAPAAAGLGIFCLIGFAPEIGRSGVVAIVEPPQLQVWLALGTVPILVWSMRALRQWSRVKLQN